MKQMLSLLNVLIAVSWMADPAFAGERPESGREDLSALVGEALVKNPEILAAIHEMGRVAAVVRQTGTWEDPLLFYEREEMPALQIRDPMTHRIGLMQSIRFPTKLGRESDMAEIRAEHAHHLHLEKVNEVIARLKVAYYDLWFVQQSILLNRETGQLLRQFAEIARTRYRVGDQGQADVLKAHVEVAQTENRLVELQQQERSAKAELMSLLDRMPSDTLAAAVVEDDFAFTPSLDTLVQLALRNRPMLVHDSLSIQESQLMVSLADQEYLPDLVLGVEYVNMPDAGFEGWSLMAGISLPFAPWSLGKAGGRTQEAEADLSKSRSVLKATENMVIADIKDLYFKVQSSIRRREAFENSILPQAGQAFEAALASYRTGNSDFLMLIDSYRTLVQLNEEALLVRAQLESAVAELERAVGLEGVARIQG